MNREDEISEKACVYSFEQSEGKNDGVDDFCFEAFYAGAEWADEHPKSPWHSNADGDLPKTDGRYIVMAQNGYCHTCQYHTDDRYWDTVGYQGDIKYWMEIPELPTE